ncbi:hypothetical protein C8P68_10641 [Mucilaginibacter yixingensis]|uniref:YD repeat-containing protein n=1 Tax=Mucilaginibacter yixingensis TaxID=1295612 RepID=A0A2T5J6Y8_9SPHI|nr:hypothetical protein [Mucilaginibacter yixingensis]PTQ94831.1 hypothetical protein C8P68_10641 [Mucilaginibacter yixingensis]
MNRTMRKWTKAALAAMLVAGAGFNVQAQNVQDGSVWAPAGTKVDGKLTEWGQGLAASNKTTLLNYTLANDDKNIYLVVKSTDQMNNRKILAGGITLSINTEGKKKEEDAYALTFPVINRENMRNSFGRRGNGGPGQGSSSTPDSSAIANMRTALDEAKDINIRGFKDIPDSVISIYNEYSIKAAVSYDDSGNFIYELSVPLKLMGLKVGDTKQLAYNLKVNGVQFNRNRENRDNNGGGQGGGRGGFGGGGNGGGGNGGGGNGGGGFGGGGGGGGRGFGGGGGGRGFGGGGGGRGGFGGGGATMADMFNPTDFWGKYTLAKKQ